MRKASTGDEQRQQEGVGWNPNWGDLGDGWEPKAPSKEPENDDITATKLSMAISMSHASIHYLQSLSNLLARKHDFYNTDAKAGSQKHSVAKVWLPLESSCLLLYPAASQFMPSYACSHPASYYLQTSKLYPEHSKKKKKKLSLKWQRFLHYFILL